MPTRVHNTALALKRSELSDRWVKPYRAAIDKAIADYVRGVATLVEGGDRRATESASLMRTLQKRLETLKKQFALPMAVDAYQIAGQEFGKTPAGKSASAVLDLTNPDAFVAARVKANVESWINRSSRIETETTAERIGKLYTQAAAEQLTPKEIADQLVKTGVAWSYNRADLLARTTTIWAYNEGAMIRYQDEGAVGIEWNVTEDDVTCPYCASFAGTQIEFGQNFVENGERVDTDEGDMKIPFDVTHPPLHPHCRCTITPILGDAGPAPDDQPVAPKPDPDDGSVYRTEMQKENPAPVPGQGVAPVVEPDRDPKNPATMTGKEFRKHLQADMKEVLKRTEKRDAEIAKIQDAAIELLDEYNKAQDALEKTEPRTKERSEAQDRLDAISDRRRDVLRKAVPLYNENENEKFRFADRFIESVRLPISERSTIPIDLEKTAANFTGLGHVLAVDEKTRIADNFGRGLDLVASVVNKSQTGDAVPKVSLRYRPGNSRPSWSENGNVVTFSTERKSIEDAVHEVFHHIEYHSPEVLRRAKEFYAARTKGEDLIPMGGGYDPWEKYRKDRWMQGEEYLGKDPNGPGYNGKATELLSRGMELLITNPARMIREDPDMFEWLIDTVRGTYDPKVPYKVPKDYKTKAKP